MVTAQKAKWWADRLSKKLNARQSEIDRIERYYEGRQPLAYATSKFRVEFGNMLSAINDNWMQLVIGAVEERLDGEGFRVAAAEAADPVAWDIWQANRLDADSQIAHVEALKHGEAHLIVWPGEPFPVITIEHPKFVCVELDPANRRQRVAAAKAWRDEEYGQCCTVYLPGEIWKFRRGQRGWEQRKVDGEDWPIMHEWGVPVIPLFNRPGLLVDGVSEIANVLSKNDMINKLMADMIVAAEYGAFRQRWATGVEIPIDPATGQEREGFASAVDRLWHVPVPDAKFGEFDQTDLKVYVSAIEMLVQHIASQTATPPHYLLSTGQLPSGESLRSAEAPLVAKARRKQRIFGDAWEDAIRLALQMHGRAEITPESTIEMIWRDPENRTESQHIDAVTKLAALEVPMPELWRLAGFSQVEIDRFRRERVANQTMLALGQPINGVEGEGPGPEQIKSLAEAAQALTAAGMNIDKALELVGLPAAS
jgi:hypothetical protein